MRINKEVTAKIKEKTRRTETVAFEINGEEYTVEVSTFFSMPIREKMIETVQLLTEENVENFGEEILGLFIFVKLMTNIEWSEVLAEDIELFISLLEFGIVNKILDVIPESTVKEMSNFLIQIADAQKIMETELNQ